MLEKVNTIIGKDRKQIKILEGHLTKLKAAIQKLTSEVEYWTQSSNESSLFSKLSSSQKQAEKLIAEVEQLNLEARDFLSQNEEFIKELGSLLEKTNFFENQITYQQFLALGAALNSDLKTALESHDYNVISTKLRALQEACSEMSGSQCMNMLGYFQKLKEHWCEAVYHEVTRALEKCMTDAGWPFVSGTKTMESINKPKKETYEEFQKLVSILVQLNDEVQLDSDWIWDVPTSFPKLSLPMRHLVKPLQKRFIFHFMTNRQTNDLGRPEWYLTQILDWCKRHGGFLDEWVQPVYDDIQRNCKVEFTGALCALVASKLERDLPCLYEDELLFSHCIDEVLAFERDLRTTLHYPATQPSVLTTLTFAPTFSRWLAIEQKYAAEKMDATLCSENAWLSLGEVEYDGVKVTECAEGFLTILLSMTERYKGLPQPGHRVQFLDLQLELLDDFRVRMNQMKNEFKSRPSEPNFTAVLNTVHYIMLVLDEWKDLPFYLQLHFHRQRLLAVQKLADSIETEEIPTLQIDDVMDTVEPVVSGTVFDPIIDLLERLQKDMVNLIVDTIVRDVKDRSAYYRKDRWHAMLSFREYVTPSLTSSICGMLQTLSMRLQNSQKMLSQKLFIDVWKSVAKRLSKFFFEEVILENRFNDGGAEQLDYDLNKGFLPIFGQYTNRPETFFSEIRESCIILKMPVGEAILLKDVLVQEDEIHGPSFRIGYRETNLKLEALKEQGIQNLSVENALAVLGRRVLMSL